MTLRVVGAGLPRTGTMSLKLALEELLGAPCYHMFEVFANPSHAAAWRQAGHGELAGIDEFLAGYAAAVDMPAAAFWRELSAVSSESLIILSERENPQQWWESVRATIFSPTQPRPVPGTALGDIAAMVVELWRTRLGADDIFDKEMMISAYRRHNEAVRAAAPAARLLEWQPDDGWAPIAAALGRPVPDKPFPRVNSRDRFALPDAGPARDRSATLS